MLIITSGENHVEQFVRALNQTHIYLESIGSQVAPDKSTIMTNDEAARDWYRQHEWPNTHAKIPVLDDARDLGAHIAATRAAHSPTFKARCEEATRNAHSVNCLPMDRKQQAKVIRTHILPNALYKKRLISSAVLYLA